MRLKGFKVIISIVLTFALLLPSILPVGVFANSADQSQNSGNAETQSAGSGQKKYLVQFKNDGKDAKKKEKVKEKINKLGAKVKKEYKKFDILQAELSEEMVKSLKKDADIVTIEPDYTFRLQSETTPWGVESIKAPQVHKSGTTGDGIKVAVLDSGISTSHSELKVEGGVSFVDGVDSYKDDNGHGTYVSGIISSIVNDSGIIGVAPSAGIYSVKVLDKDGVGSYSSVIEGIEWAIENNMDIINMSFGAPEYSKILEEAVNKAYNSNILMFAAAGNKGMAASGTSVDYPARFENVVAVGAVDRNESRASFSSTGKELELMAPGVDIYSTLMNGNYGSASGTSAACPHAAGAAALVWSKYPQKTNAEVRKVLDDTASRLGDTALYGNGLLDASAAMGISDPAVTPEPASTPAVTPLVNQSDRWIKLELDKDTANVGDIVTASVKINKIENCTGCQVNIKYDPEILQPVNPDTGVAIDKNSIPKGGDLFNDSNYFPFLCASNNMEKGYVSIGAIYLNANGFHSTTDSGTVATLGFKVLKENAAEISIEDYVEYDSKIEGALIFDSISGKLPEESYSIIQPSIINGHLPELVKDESKVKMASTNMVMSTIGATTHTVSGYVDVDCIYSEGVSNVIRQGFKVEVYQKVNGTYEKIEGISDTTNEKGYFEIKDFTLSAGTSEDIAFKISKPAYLYRMVDASRYISNMQLGTKEKPVLMWGGDANNDNAIGMQDYPIIAAAFNNYSPDLDFNKDGTVNMADVMIASTHFNCVPSSYPKQEIYLNQDIEVGAVNDLTSINENVVLNLNGRTMRVLGNLRNKGKIIVNNGVLVVDGYYVQDNGDVNAYLDLSNGIVKVYGNAYIHTGTVFINGGYMEMTHFQFENQGILQMTNDLDYIKVNGNMTFHSLMSHANNLTAGTLELKDGFTINNSLGTDGGFRASGTHKVILSKESGTQYVNMSGDSNSKFNIVLLTRDFTTSNYSFNPINCYNNLIVLTGQVKGLNDGIHAPAGEYAKEFVDMTCDSPGFGVVFSRKYNSENNAVGAFGKGWTFGFDSVIECTEYNENGAIWKSYEVTFPDGNKQTFSEIDNNGTAVYQAVDSRSKLEKSGDNFILTTKDQYKYHYAPKTINGKSVYALVEIYDKAGNYIQIGDIVSGVRTITDGTGKTYTINYVSTTIDGTAYDLISKITDNTGTTNETKRVVDYTYTNGKLTNVKNAVGNMAYYEYSSTTGLLEWIKATETGYSDFIEAVKYYSNNEMEYNIYASGKAEHYIYNTSSTQIEDMDATVDSTGSITYGSTLSTTALEYDETLAIQRRTVTKGTETYTSTTEYGGWSKYGEEKSTTDFNGNKTTYERDLRGNITKIINPDESISLYGYNDTNDLIWELDEEGEYTLYVYNGGLLSEKAKLLKKIKDTQISNYLVIDSSNENEFSITQYDYYSYSSTPTSNPQNVSVTNPTYNIYGLLASETQFMPSGNIVTEHRYYANGNLAWSKNPETGNFTIYSDKVYSSKGWKVIEFSPIGHSTEFYHNKNGQIYKEIKKPSTADKQSIKVTVYDTLGRKVQEVSPNLCALYYNNSTDTFSKQDIGSRYAYKGKSGVINQVTDPLNNVTVLLSDVNGNVVSETKPNNAVYEYEYDGLNRQTEKWFKENANATAQLLEEYTYSVESGTKYTVKTSKKYIDAATSADTITKSDYAGRIVYRKNPENYEMYTEYYRNGEVKKVTDPMGYSTYFKYGLYDSTTGYTYDEKWSAFKVDVGGTTMYKYSKTMYDKTGRIVKSLVENDKTGVTYDETANSGNGDGERPTEFKETNYEYFKDGVVSNIQVVNGTTTQYTYDDDRNVKSEVVTIDTGRILTTEYETNYLGKVGYKTACVRKGDIYGNNFDTDNDNIYVSTRYDYDVEGNLKTTTGPLLRTTVDGVYTYSNIAETFTATYYYDAMNRTTGVSQPGVDETGAAANIVTTTVYNWEGKPLITTDANGDTTEYEYDQMGLLTKLKKGNEIVGVTDSGFTTTGTWTDGTEGGYRNGAVKYTSTSGCTANWLRTIDYTGIYDVYVKCPEVQDGSTSATYKVYNGSTLCSTVTVNQYANRGNWVRLGRYIFTSDLTGKVSLTTGSSKTYADAVKFENINMSITAYKYDLAGRLLAQVNPKDYTDGVSIDTMNRTVYTYDGMGRMKTTGFKGYEKQIDPATTGWESSPVAIDITTKSVDYDGNGNAITETDGEGSSTYYKYTPANQLERILEPELKNDYPDSNIENLYSRRFEYDTLDRKVLESNIKGYLTEKYYINTWYQYDDTANTMLVKTAVNSNNIEAEAKPMAEEFYDYGGNLKSRMDANNLAKTTGAKTVDYIFNSFNKPKSVIYPGDYEADVTGSTLPERKVNYQYDYFGNVKKEFETYKMKVKTSVSTYTSITKVKDYTYDKQGRLLLKEEYQSDNKAGTLIQNSFKYDRNGNKRYETDGNANTTQYRYDWFGRVINKSLSYTDSSTTPSRTVTLSTLYTYDANGNVKMETDEVADSTNSSTSTYAYDYDSQNRLIEKQDEGVVIQRLEYYNNGLQKSSYDAVNSAAGTKLRLTSFTYDKNGRLKSTTDPVNTADSSYPYNHTTSNRTNTYDYAGNLIEVKDGNNSYTDYTYNVLDRLEEVKNRDINEKYKYEYDDNGNMTKQTALHLVSGAYIAYSTMDYTYNDGNLLTERKTQLENTDRYSYYADGTVKEKTDRNAAKTSYVYDIHGRLVLQKTEKTGAATVNVEYVYDNNDNQLQVIDSTGTTTRTYDAMNRVLTKQVPNIGTVKYSYDILSTRTEFAGLTAEICEYPLCTNNTAANKTTKVYDRSKRLKYVVDGDTAGTIIATYTYNNDGSRRSLVYGNNYREDYVYWEDGNLKSLTNKKADGTTLDIYQYQYDGAHNQIRKYEYINGSAKGTTIYEYDKMNRMNKVTEPSGRITDYTFDPEGNRKTEIVTEGTKVTTNTYDYTTENLLDSIDTEVKVNGITTETHNNEYTYDANGNTETVSKDGTLQNTYEYDLINRMTTVKNSGGTVIATYSYNGEGLRVGKVEGTNTTIYLYEYDKVILEVDGSNNQVGRNIYGTNLLMRTMNDQVPTGQTFYYMYNGHGDVTAFLNRDTGMLAATYYYDAFGNIKNEQHYDVNGNPTSVKYNNSILYAGYQYDGETGLYYLNARMYDPVTARFLQEDTVSGNPNDPLSLNLYTYCHNEPIMYNDPNGNEEIFLTDWATETGLTVTWNQKTKTASIDYSFGYSVNNSASFIVCPDGNVQLSTSYNGYKEFYSSIGYLNPIFNKIVLNDGNKMPSWLGGMKRNAPDKAEWDKVEPFVEGKAISSDLRNYLHKNYGPVEATQKVTRELFTNVEKCMVNYKGLIDEDIRKMNNPSLSQKEYDSLAREVQYYMNAYSSLVEQYRMIGITIENFRFVRNETYYRMALDSLKMSYKAFPILASSPQAMFEISNKIMEGIGIIGSAMASRFSSQSVVPNEEYTMRVNGKNYTPKNGSQTAYKGTLKTPNVNTKVINAAEVKAPNAIKSSDVTNRWNSYLGENTTNINPRTGQVDPNRIFSADGTKSVRFDSHEMNSMGTPKFHYHEETWTYDAVNDTMTVTNTLQRIK